MRMRGWRAEIDEHPALAPDSNALGETDMRNIEQRVGLVGAPIEVLLTVFCGDCGPEVEISKGIAVAEHSQTQQNMVLDYLRDRHAIWMRWFENEIEARYVAVDGGLEIIADVLQKGFEDQKRFRRAFMNTSAENRDINSEPFAIAPAQQEHLRQFIVKLAARMGLRYPSEAAAAAVLVIVRTIVQAQTTGGLKEARTARLLLQCLHHA